MPDENDVHFSSLSSAQAIPVLAQSAKSGVSPADWGQTNREKVRQALAAHGAILFRGFEIDGQAGFEGVVEQLVGKKLDYVYRTTLRSQVAKGVYTATDYPARLTIPFHNENAYQRDWPMHLAFFCVKPAEEGGETPIADTVRVTARIDPAIKDQFRAKGVMYLRNYRPGVDMSWQMVFQTENKEELAAYCREHEIDHEWKSDDWLQTRQVCHALATHPDSGQEIWFNQAHLFHASNLEDRTRKAVLSLYGDEGFPRNAYYGDGTPIDDDTLAGVRAAFRAEASTFQWKPNDLLLVDNMLVSHSRNPYKGERKILVCMANPYSEAKGKARATHTGQ